MDIDTVIKEIAEVTKKQGWEIDNMIHQKIKDNNHEIDGLAAAKLVAADLNVEIKEEKGGKSMLPSVDEMIEMLLKVIPQSQITQEIKELQEKRPIYKHREQMAYKHLCDKHHIGVTINTPNVQYEKGEYTPLKDLTSDSWVNIRGYFLSFSEVIPNKKSGERMYITFADETGLQQITVFQGPRKDGTISDLCDKLTERFQQFPVGVYIVGARTGEYQGSLQLQFTDKTGIEEIGIGDNNLPPLTELYSSFDNTNTERKVNKIYTFHGYLSSIAEVDAYIGCRECKKKVELEVGEIMPTCAICGAKNAEVIQFVKKEIVLSDEFGDVETDFMLQFKPKQFVIIEDLEDIIQPEVILVAKESEQYGLNGIDIISLEGVTIDEGTGKIQGVSPLDKLDFSFDEERQDWPLVEGKPDPKLFAPCLSAWERMKYYPDMPLSEFIEKMDKKTTEVHNKVQYKLKPVIEHLYNTNKISINDGKINEYGK